MASTRRRGNEKENQAQKELEAEGYRVVRAMPEIKWIPPWPKHPFYWLWKKNPRFRVPISTRHDLLEVGDILAVKLDETRLIQVTIDSPSTHGAHPSERRKKMAEAAETLPLAWTLEVWRWIPRRGWWKEVAVRGKLGTVLDWVDLEKPVPKPRKRSIQSN